MAEDIVERLRNPDYRGPFQHLRGWDELDELHDDAATTIESLRAQLATSHALGFKAGIEAVKEVAHAQIEADRALQVAAMRQNHREDTIMHGAEVFAAQSIISDLASLPTPPSMLPEILEAMRPVAREAESYGAAENAGKPFPDALKVGNGNVTVGDLRAIAAVFTKLGGKIDG